MSVVICERNKEKIQAMIDSVQKKSRVRTITVNDVYDAVVRIEEKLSIPKKHLIGIKAYVDPNAQHFPNAYKYIPESTQFVIERNSKAWVLIGVYRETCKRSRDKEFELILSDEASAAIIKRFAHF